MRQNKFSGVGLLELMLVLVVIAAIILMAVRYFGMASEDVKVTKTVKIVRDVVRGSFEWLKVNPKFDSKFNVRSLDGYVTDNCKRTSSDTPCIKDPWDSLVKVTAKSDNQIEIELPNVPLESCKAISDIMQQQNMSPAACSGGSGYVAYYPYK